MIPAGFHSHRADLDAPRGGLSFSHGFRDLNPPDESLLFGFFFLFSSHAFISLLDTSIQTRRHFIFTRLIKFGATSMLISDTYVISRPRKRTGFLIDEDR